MILLIVFRVPYLAKRLYGVSLLVWQNAFTAFRSSSGETPRGVPLLVCRATVVAVRRLTL
jgi:hypothetical protein